MILQLIKASFVKSVTIPRLYWGSALRNHRGYHLSDLSLYQASTVLRARSKNCEASSKSSCIICQICHCINTLLRASSKNCAASSKSPLMPFVRSVTVSRLYWDPAPSTVKHLQIALGAICQICHCIKPLLRASSKNCEASSKSPWVSFVRSVTVSRLYWDPALGTVKHPPNSPWCHLSDLPLYQPL